MLEDRRTEACDLAIQDGQVALMTLMDYAEGEEVCIFYERAAPWLFWSGWFA